MLHYSHITLVRLLLPFMAGIIIFLQVNYLIAFSAVLGLIVLLIAALVIISRFFLGNIRFSYIYGVIVNLVMVISGYVLAQNHYQLDNPKHFSRHFQNGAMLRIRLIEPVSEKTNSFQVVGRVTHIVGDSGITKVAGKIIVWLQKDSLARNLNYGDVLLLENNFQETEPPKNPNSFNYKQFLERQNIFHQTYRKSGEWFFTGKNEGSSVIKYAHTMRKYALETLEANNIKGKDFAVASALLLGFRENLDEDLQREFAGAGAMHILCVSGLHVGVIFLALSFMLGFLKAIPKGKYIKTIIIILFIWLYAAITGFAPSVLRAATMFSFVAIGQSFDRNTNIYNTLAGSALFLSIIDPFIISRLGFQLSYIAVLSIVSFQPILYRQIYFKNKIIDGIWGIVTVSIAAQIGTAPLAIYYFNQFPNYFLLTNIIVIPLTDIIIKGGILFFIISPFHEIAQHAGTGLSALVWVLHSAVRFIEGLPGSASTGITISFIEQIMLLSVVGFLAMFLMFRQKRFAVLILAGTLAFSASMLIRKTQQQSKKQLVVYHVPGATAIDLFFNGNCYALCCQQLTHNPKAAVFNLGGNRMKMGARVTPTLFLTDSTNLLTTDVVIKNNFIYTGSIKVKIIDPETPMPDQPFDDVDIFDAIIIRQNPRFNLDLLHKKYPAKVYVFDSSNSISRQRRWLQHCDTLGIDCWSVSLQGAFISEL